MKKRIISFLTPALLCGALCLFTACEDNARTVEEDESSGENWVGFYIDPAAKNMASTNGSAVFTAIGGKDPIVWTLSDASLGSIGGTVVTGRAVTYNPTAGQTGVNILHVEDANHWTATAAISQE